MNQTSKLAKQETFKEKLKGLQTNILKNPKAGFEALKTTAVHLKQLYQDINKARCAILAIAAENWDLFPLTEVSEWDYDYYKFAKEFTGGYTRRSIDNMKRVGEAWLTGSLPLGIPDKVALYDENGQPVFQKETGEIMEVETDPYEKASFSKLLVATGAAHDGRLVSNEIALGQLFNPDVSVRNLSDTLQGRAKHKKKDKIEIVPETFFILDGPYLIAKRGPEEALIAELNLEAAQEQYSVGAEAINKLKRVLNL